ncbi:MAG TPA: TatD family hydrolase [Planctomycetota bacterium]|nr:TatD family hydrolase [Planctomycetota bacterium]
MIIDTHCHLSYPDFDRDRDEMLARAKAAGVEAFVTIATGPEDWRRCLDLAEGRPAVRVAMGIHPNEADIYSEKTFAELSQLARGNNRVVGIGETGLDYYRENSPREKQRASFDAHLNLAEELKKPFILHCRAAEDDMLKVLEERAATGKSLHGVWHCFSASPDVAKRAMKLGLYFGLGGISTYPKATDVRAAAAIIPADRIVLETDCPFLPPQGWRGQRNEPAYLKKVVEVLAETRSVPPSEIERLTSENARRLFGEW